MDATTTNGEMHGQGAADDSRRRIIAGALFFAACFIYAISVMSVGWHHTIADAHGFRQTQTAISVQSLVDHPGTLAYETPVLGPPWSIPFEFPLYQWVVAGIVWATAGRLDETGRFVSVAFFLLSLLPGYFILGRLKLSPEARFIVLSLFLISPFYLFWSRTFLIESAALFLSLTYLATSLAAIDRRRLGLIVLAMSLGVLAAAVKITTFAIVLLPVAVLIVSSRSARPSGPRRSVVPMLGELLCLVAIPVGLAVLWTRYADAQKQLNPSAGFLVSSALHTWCFGTLEQRLTPATWMEILQRASLAVDPLVLLGGLLAVVATRRFRGLCATCLGLYLLGPLMFVNLYYWHEYYAYANALFLVAAAGLGLAALIDGGARTRRVGWLLLPLVFGLACLRHREHYLPTQQTNFVYAATVGRVIEQATEEEEVVVTLGLDWSPVVPYYSRRRSMMIRGTPHAGWAQLDTALDQLAQCQLGAVVVVKSDLEPVAAADVRQSFARRGYQVQEIFSDDNMLIYRIRATAP